MKTSEVNESLIGKKVSGIFTALEVTGTITGIIENEYTTGVRIKLVRGDKATGEIYTEYDSTARICDEFGNLKYTKVIS
jgi:hypothetical protein